MKFYHVGGAHSGANYLYFMAITVGLLKQIDIVNKGGQYTSANVITTGNGSGATATATIVDGSIAGITITTVQVTLKRKTWRWL